MTSESSSHHEDHDHSGHHVMPLSMLFTIFGALIFLTLLTVTVGQFSLGKWEILITMMIATTKAILVAVFFMHLKYDRPFNAMIFSFSLFFVALFLGIVLMDVGAYKENLIPPAAPAAAATEMVDPEAAAGEGEDAAKPAAAPAEDKKADAEPAPIA